MAHYTLTINVYPSTAWGTVTANPTNSVGHDLGVYDSTLEHTPTITAYPEAGYVFSHWTVGLTGSVNPQSPHLTASITVNAYFAVPETGDGAIALSPLVVLLWWPITPTLSITLPISSIVESNVVVGIDDINGAILKEDSPLTYTDYTVAANEDTANDVNLLPATPAINDAFFFGVSDIDYGWLRYVINIGTAGVGTWTLTYYYYNGATWVALPSANIINKSPQFKDFMVAGLGSLWIIPPDDWAIVAVNGVTRYWLEARVTSYSAKTTIPLATRIYQEHEEVEGGETFYVDPSDSMELSDSFGKVIYINLPRDIFGPYYYWNEDIDAWEIVGSIYF